MNELRLASQPVRSEIKTNVRLPTILPREEIGQAIAAGLSVETTKRFVYILQSESATNRYYTGLTGDFSLRLADHNAGRCQHTATGRPWKKILVAEFADERKAISFEKYLKSGSGCAFSKRHFR